MNNRELNWSKLSWQDFQKVSLFVYRETTGDRGIEEFLKPGHFQSGIDLLSFRSTNGKFVCIQCKHSALTLANLKKILQLFLSGEFGEISDSFLLMTSADLQKPAIQTWITEKKIALHKNKGIAFDVWDRERLKIALTDQYKIVEKFFGVAEADAHCFQPPVAIPVPQTVNGYIQRHIQLVSETGEGGPWNGEDKPRSTLTLTQLLTGALEGKNAFGIVAEAYEGKSSLLRQTAWELAQLDPAIVPLVLDLKFCSVLPVTQLLANHFGEWREIPTKNLVLFIDGLDEVPAEQFNTVVSYIRDFMRNHAAIRLVISCRKMFYNYQHLAQELSGFEFYELLDLHLKQIFVYLETQLGEWNTAMRFYTQMNGLGISNLLGAPFYLTQMVKWFTASGQQVPRSKMEIAERFVDESLQVSATRKLRTGLSLDKFKVKYRTALQQFALLLQIKGLNACEEEPLQELFKQEDIDLLTHSSVLQIHHQQWSFLNAMFQEQLAALALKKLSIETVINLVTQGTNIRKVSRKWIQTVATYLSILPEGNKDREQLVAVIESDNIELLALSEGSKFSAAFRLEVLQKILKRSSKHQARLVAIEESDLAAFAGNSDACVDELLQVIGSDEPMIVKIVAARTLRYLPLSTNQAERYAKLAKPLLIALENPDLGRLLLEAIAHYGLGDDQFLSQLTQNPLFKTSHEFRQGFYQYLSAHGLVDAYYDELLSGFDPLYRYNTDIAHYGSEKRLLDLLMKTRDRRLMTKLLNVVRGEAFQKFFRDDKDGTKGFYRSLAKASAEIYQVDALMIFPIANYLMATGRHHYDREPNELSEFLGLTGSYSLGFRIALLAGKETLQKYAFCGAMHPDCFPDIYYALEEGFMDRADMQVCCNGLYYGGRKAEAEELERKSARIFGYKKEPDPEVNVYHRVQERKRKNDLNYIGSRESFREGIIKLFTIAGKEEIATEELYERFDEDNPLNKVNSSLLTWFIGEQAEEKVAKLSTCLEAVDDIQYFKIWRIDKLMKSYLPQYYPDLVCEQIKIYYDEEVAHFPFAEVNLDSAVNIQYQAGQFLKIWAHYQFPTTDEILLEFIRMNMEGYNSISFKKTNKQKSVISLLLKHFAGRSDLLKQRVLTNLRNGLSSDEVIGTHFEICRELHITEALPFILDAILNKRSQSRFEDDYISLYVALGGAHADLLSFFQANVDLNGYLFLFMIKFFEPYYPQLAEEKLLACLHARETDASRKIEAAQRLAQLGNGEGFLFLINKFEAGKPAAFDLHGKIAVWNVSTQWGLEQLRPFMSLILDEKSEMMRFHHSPKYLLLEILNGFAGKSEADLELVTNFMNACAEQLAAQFPQNFGHLAWHAEQTAERYRNIDIVPLTHREIKQLFAQING